jgi:hypothetical protein
MPIDGGAIEQLTSVMTGVSGITTSSPALTVAATGRMAFSLFEKDGDAIYVLDPANVFATVPPASSTRAAVMPSRIVGEGLVFGLVNNFGRGLPVGDRPTPTAPYKSKLKLDFVGQPEASVGYNQWGTVVGGSISAFFSDMVGDRVLSMGLAAAGSVTDIGGQVTLLNRRHRWNWGAAVEQSPNRIDSLAITADPLAGQHTVYQLIERRQSIGGFGLAAYPLNGADRIEFTGGARHYLNLTQEIQAETFDDITGDLITQSDVKTVIGRPLSLLQFGTAFVHDTSFFGATSPIYGRRYRAEIGESIGTLQYTSAVGDFRQYFMPRRPLTIAVRVMTAGRYGSDAGDVALTPLFVGYPDLVHGYGYGSIRPSECYVGRSGPCQVLDQMVGTRILIGNLEVRGPLIGLLRHDLTYGRLPLEVAAFYDVGLAWTASLKPEAAGGDRTPVRSAGGAVRFNVFGILVLELSAAHPFDRPGAGLQWQFGVRQGF